jgi:hypothetical protein
LICVFLDKRFYFEGWNKPNADHLNRDWKQVIVLDWNDIWDKPHHFIAMDPFKKQDQFQLVWKQLLEPLSRSGDVLSAIRQYKSALNKSNPTIL